MSSESNSGPAQKPVQKSTRRSQRQANQPSKQQPGSGGGFVHRSRPVVIPDGYLVVGQITGAHANRGEIKIENHSDFPERFAAGSVLLMGADLEPVELLSSRPHKAHVLVTLEGVQSREAAQAMRGTWLYVAEEDAAELDDDTFWIHDLMGLTVVTDTGRTLGTVTEVLSTGANDVYVVRPADGVNRGRDILLPAIAQVVLAVDVDAGTITVQLMPGLLEED